MAEELSPSEQKLKDTLDDLDAKYGPPKGGTTPDTAADIADPYGKSR